MLFYLLSSGDLKNYQPIFEKVIIKEVFVTLFLILEFE